MLSGLDVASQVVFAKSPDSVSSDQPIDEWPGIFGEIWNLKTFQIFKN